MQRAALGLGAFLSTLAPCVTALAHGEAPAAYAVLSHDAQGARAVRLSAGVALRRASQRFQFVCPSAWGDEYAAPLAALDDGTIVVGAASGLMLLGEDGKVRTHPDPAAAGNTTEVVRAAQGVFALRSTQDGSELLAVDAEKVRVLWKDPKSLYSLAALDDKLVLLRASTLALEQVTIAAADGKELERQMAVVASPIDYAYARATAGAAYALVLFRTSAVLGSLRMNAFTKIAEGELSIAGPLSVGGSPLLIALDGQFSQLVDGQPRSLEGTSVLCLEQHDGLAYACNPEGIARVSGQALGEPLFRLSWLVSPNRELLAEGAPRDRCNAQWQDLRVDLLTAGTSLPEDEILDAGSEPVDAAIADGSAEPLEAGNHEAGAADAGQVAAVTPPKKGGASCSALPVNGGSCIACVSALTLFVFARARNRALRRHLHARSS